MKESKNPDQVSPLVFLTQTNEDQEATQKTAQQLQFEALLLRRIKEENNKARNKAIGGAILKIVLGLIIFGVGLGLTMYSEGAVLFYGAILGGGATLISGIRILIELDQN